MRAVPKLILRRWSAGTLDCDHDQYDSPTFASLSPSFPTLRSTPSHPLGPSTGPPSCLNSSGVAPPRRPRCSMTTACPIRVDSRPACRKSVPLTLQVVTLRPTLTRFMQPAVCLFSFCSPQIQQGLATQSNSQESSNIRVYYPAPCGYPLVAKVLCVLEGQNKQLQSAGSRACGPITCLSLLSRISNLACL